MRQKMGDINGKQGGTGMIDHEKPEELPDDTGGMGGDRGELMGSDRHRRSDARMAARLISLGVIPEEQAKSLLIKGFGLAAASTTSRDYASAMQIPLSVARLELEQLKIERDEIKETGNTYQQVNVYVPDNGRYQTPSGPGTLPTA